MMHEDIWRHESLNVERMALELLKFLNKNKDKNKGFVFGDKARLNQDIWQIYS
jgi:hypothetical protein